MLNLRCLPKHGQIVQANVETAALSLKVQPRYDTLVYKGKDTSNGNRCTLLEGVQEGTTLTRTAILRKVGIWGLEA